MLPEVENESPEIRTWIGTSDFDVQVTSLKAERSFRYTSDKSMMPSMLSSITNSI